MEQTELRWHIIWMTGGALWLLAAAVFFFLGRSGMGLLSIVAGVCWICCGVLQRRLLRSRNARNDHR